MLWLLSFPIELVCVSILFSPKAKRYLAILLVAFVVFTSISVTATISGWFTVVIITLLPFRLLNIARVIKGRMHPFYLRRVVTRTSLSILGLHLIGFMLVFPKTRDYWSYLPIISTFVAIIMIVLLARHLVKTKHITNSKHYSDNELPTVSVCLPARNETDELRLALQSIIANDYHKLEILVLDDCSQDKTAEVIKSFAHDGVRFVQGEPPSDRWLAKNQAYDKLVHEANGELILFCGVDVRLGPHAIRALATTMLNRKKAMISVMPLRFYSKLADGIIQPMRYWWELVPPRKLFRRPAVLGTCWLVNRKALMHAGGFAAVSHSIIPERFFARHFIKTDEYSFIRADEELDVRTAKPFQEQLATAIRTNYPQIRRRPEMALLLTAFTLTFMLAPYIWLPWAIVTLNTGLALLLAVNCSVLVVVHVLILQYSDPANVPAGFLTMPLAVISEIAIGYVSMYRYEFGTVDWKDRNVCIPVMHVIPKAKFLAEQANDDQKTSPDSE